MRCHCPHCEEETLMVHSERDLACVCPQCLYRCYACQGTGTALTKEEVSALKNSEAILFAAHAFDTASDTLPSPGHAGNPAPNPLSPEDR